MKTRDCKRSSSGKKSSLQGSGRQLGTLTGLTFLANTPFNLHPLWFHTWNDVEHSLTTLVTTSLDRDSKRRHKSLTSSEKKDDTSNQLKLTKVGQKLLTPDGCSRTNTGCTPPSNHRLRRLYSLIYSANSTVVSLL